MRKTYVIMALAATCFLLASCGAPAANNASANKPTNASNNANAPKPDTAAVEADVKKMMADFEAALNKNDADAVGKFYSDDYTLIDQNGEMQTKASRTEQIRSGKIKWEGLKFNDLKIRTHPAGDGAALYAHATGKTTVDGKTEDRDSMVTWVARKMPDGWKFIHAQITDVKAGAQKSAAPSPAANTSAANTGAANASPANK